MTPLRYYVLPRIEVARLTRDAPIPSGFLQDWEAARPGILDDSSRDIVAVNSRSHKQRWKAYECFSRVTDWKEANFIYACDWLELFQSGGVRQNIAVLIEHVSETYPGKAVLYSWNHDIPEDDVPELCSLEEGSFCLSYNSRKPTPQDICVTFWNVETRLDWSPTEFRPLRGGFIGFVSPSLKARSEVVNAFSRPGWQIRNTRLAGNLSHEEYYRTLMAWNFSLCPRGGGLSSYRWTESIHAGAVPLLFADDVTLPFPDLDYSQFQIRIPEAQAGNFEYVNDLLSDVDVVGMRHALADVRQRFSLRGVQEEVFKKLSNFLN